MSVNYLIEINGLDDWEFGNPLSATAYKVMRKLQYVANKQRFPEQIKISNTSLCLMVGCSENSLIAARQQLIQRGLIEYSGKRKHTPVYIIHYFSDNPAYNRKNCGIDEGIGVGIDEGIGVGIPGGQDRGRYINKHGVGIEDDEEDYDTHNPNIPAEVRTIDNNSPLHYHSPTEGLVGVQTRAGAEERTPLQCMVDEQRMLESFKRRGCRMIYAPREKPLGPTGQREYERIMSHLAYPDIRHLYGDGMQVLRQIADSDYYPLMLIDYAIEKTIDRQRMYPAGLDTPIAYTIKLLDDWKRRGFNMPGDVRRAKDDYSDDY